jgi:hypothetical protein
VTSYFAQTPDVQGTEITATNTFPIFGFLVQLLKWEPVRVRDLAANRVWGEEITMQLPSILRGESPERLLQGATAGVTAGIAVGFYWDSWSLGNSADKVAAQRSARAVVAAMAPVCNDKFHGWADAEAKKVTLFSVIDQLLNPLGTGWRWGTF